MELLALSGPCKNGISLRMGRLSEITESGALVVEMEGDFQEQYVCDWLETNANCGIRLNQGDLVLVLLQDDLFGKPCVLGRIARYEVPSTPEAFPPEKSNPEILELRAKQQIVLSCGDSALVLRHDGKVLIRGVDVVSKASRTQRIKGGSVQIN